MLFFYIHICLCDSLIKKEIISRNTEQELTFFLDHMFRNDVKFLKSRTTVNARLPDVFVQLSPMGLVLRITQRVTLFYIIAALECSNSPILQSHFQKSRDKRPNTAPAREKHASEKNNKLGKSETMLHQRT